MKWMGPVAHMWKKSNACNISVQEPEGRDRFVDLVILEWSLQKLDLVLVYPHWQGIINAVMNYQVP
jgi:hypothetical protein